MNYLINNVNKNYLKNICNFQDLIKEKENLPIYIIQSHGTYNIRIKENNNNISFDNNELKNNIELNNNTYIIDTTPLDSYQISSNNDIINIKKIINNSDRFKTEIFSNKFLDTFKYSSNIKNYSSEIIVGPPRYNFPNKLLYFYDNKNKKYNFEMGIIEVCKETKKIKLEINKGYNNKSLPDKLHRIWNYHLNTNKIFSEKNLINGEKIKKIIENSIKKETYIELKDLIKILGKGIYVLFTCSNMTVEYNNTEIELYKRKIKQSKKQLSKINYIYKKCYEKMYNETEKLKYNWYDMVKTIKLQQKTRNKKDMPYLLRNRIKIEYKYKNLINKYYHKKYY